MSKFFAVYIVIRVIVPVSTIVGWLCRLLTFQVTELGASWLVSNMWSVVMVVTLNKD